MRLTKIDANKLGWLFRNPQFQEHKVKTLSRVFLWELKRLRKQSALVQFDGADFFVDSRDGIGRVLYYFDGRLEQDIFSFLNRYLQPGYVVVDAGANIGIYTMFAAKRVTPGGIVYGFEPNPRVFSRLERNATADNVRLMPYALNEHPGTVAFQVVEDTAKSTTFAADEEAATFDVTSLSLDSFSEEILESDSIDYLKVDVAGADYQVLLGAQKLLAGQKIRLVQIECLHDEAEIRTLLLDHGYRLGCLLADGTITQLRHDAPTDAQRDDWAPLNLFAHPPDVQVASEH